MLLLVNIQGSLQGKQGKLIESIILQLPATIETKVKWRICVCRYTHVTARTTHLLSGYSTYSALAHLYISLLHVVMMVEGFVPMLYPLSALYTTYINFPILIAYSHMCFVFAHP